MSTIIHTRVGESSLATALQYFTACGVNIRTRSQLIALVLDAFANSTGYPALDKDSAKALLDRHFSNESTVPTISLPRTNSIAEQVRLAVEKNGIKNEND